MANLHLSAIIVIVVLVAGLFAKEMTGIHLRIAAVPEPPAFNIIKGADNVTRHVGVVPDIIELLSGRLGFTYSYVDIPMDETKKTGLTNSSVQNLLEKKVDLVSSLTAPTAERLHSMDFTVPLLIQSYSIVQPMPKLESPLLAVIMSFHPLVWLTILVTLVAVVGASSLICYCYPERTDRPLPDIVIQSANYVLLVILNQGGTFPSSRLSPRIIIGTFCLIAIVLVNTYNGMLTSRLSAPKYEPIINSLDELAESKDIRPLAAIGTVLTSYFLKAKSGTALKLGDSLRRNPHDVLTSETQLYDVISTGCCAYPIIDDYANFMIAKTMTPLGQCQLTKSELIAFNQQFSFATHKNTAWLKAMDREILNLWANGMLTKWVDSATKIAKIAKCQETKRFQSSKGSAMSLKTLSSAFLILAVGLGISLVAIVMEIICRFYKRARKTKPIKEIVAPSSGTTTQI